MVKLEVKWNKDTFQVEADTSEGFEAFQGQLFSLTNVPAERQKILAKGKKIDNIKALEALQDGTKLMLMGSADAPLKEPTKQQVFMEDLNEDQKVSITGALGGGLNNLGNTCYMNSTIQCFRAIPEMKQHLWDYSKQASTKNDVSDDSRLVASLGRLFHEQDTSSGAKTPFEVVTFLRKAFPQFAETSPQSGAYMQQDADECLQQLVTTIDTKVKSHPADDQKANSLISYLFDGEMTETTKCLESEEPATTTVSSFRRLKCNINNEINYMAAGINLGLNESLEFRSAALGRNAQHTRTSRIHKLPRYLNVQFVRFFWKNDKQLKSKILRKVQYGLKFDILEFCDEELKKKLTHARRVLAKDQDKLLGIDLKKAAAATTTATTTTTTTATTTTTEKKAEDTAMDTTEDLDDTELDTSGNYRLIGAVKWRESR